MEITTGSHIVNLMSAQIEAEVFVDYEINTYAEQSCRALCAAMQRSLPRELRDMIYDHVLSLVPDEPLEIYDDALDAADGSYREEIAEMVEDDGYAHMCSEDFVDLATMSEFARRWYTKVRFDLYLTPAEVAKFFETDIWGLGICIDGLLSHVEVEILEDVSQDNVTPLQQSPVKLAPHASIFLHLRTDLVNIGGESHFDTDYTLDVLSDRLSELFPLIRQLLEAGYKLYGSLDQYEDFRITLATLDREIWKNTLVEHRRHCDCKSLPSVVDGLANQLQGNSLIER
jgi:hypothetical protein